MLLLIDIMSKRVVKDGDIEEYETHKEALDLDIYAKKSRSRSLGEGEFLTGSDSVKEFLAKRVIPDGSEFVHVNVPRVIFEALSPGVSRWKALQEWLFNRDVNLMVGRVFDDLYSFIQSGNRETPESTMEYRKAQWYLVDAYKEVFGSVKDWVLRDEKNEFERVKAEFERERKELRKQNSDLRGKVDALIENIEKYKKRAKSSVNDNDELMKKIVSLEFEKNTLEVVIGNLNNEFSRISEEHSHCRKKRFF